MTTIEISGTMELPVQGLLVTVSNQSYVNELGLSRHLSLCCTYTRIDVVYIPMLTYSLSLPFQSNDSLQPSACSLHFSPLGFSICYPVNNVGRRKTHILYTVMCTWCVCTYFSFYKLHYVPTLCSCLSLADCKGDTEVPYAILTQVCSQHDGVVDRHKIEVLICCVSTRCMYV